MFPLASVENVGLWIAISLSAFSSIVGMLSLIVIWFVLPNAASFKSLEDKIDAKDSELQERAEAHVDSKLAGVERALNAEVKAIRDVCSAFDARFAAGHTHMGKLDEGIAQAAQRDNDLRIEILKGIGELRRELAGQMSDLSRSVATKADLQQFKEDMKR